MFETQISKGVKYLDEDLGPNWPERISLDELDMVDCLYCVIGQLYGEYFEHMQSFDGTPLGFDLIGSGYDILTAEWKAKIVQLRAERKAK